MPYVIASPCIDVMDRSCIEECPVDCIYEGERKLYINPTECIDCGACEPVCPVEAISQDRRVPAEDSDFVEDNRQLLRHRVAGARRPNRVAGRRERGRARRCRHHTGGSAATGAIVGSFMVGADMSRTDFPCALERFAGHAGHAFQHPHRSCR